MRLAAVCALLLLHAVAAAQWAAQDPASVGIAFAAIEAERSADGPVASQLEDHLRTHLPAALRHPVAVGSDLAPALPDGAARCVADIFCMNLLGGQFNASLLVVSTLVRAGNELTLETDWYSTGNGAKIAREFIRFAPGDERAAVTQLQAAFARYFDASLKMRADARAGEGGIVQGGKAEQAERADEYREGRTKRVSSRRTDFGAEGSEAPIADSRDPAADLRRVAAEDADEPEATGREDARSRRARRDAETLTVDEPEVSGVEDAPQEPEATGRGRVDDDPVEPRAGRSTRREDAPDTRRERTADAEPTEERPVREEPAARRAADRGRTDDATRRDAPQEDEEPADFDALDEDGVADLDRGRPTPTPAYDARSAGYGPREQLRYERSGLGFDDFHARRWSLGRRFQLRVGVTYGLGYLTRRYATLAYLRAGGVKSDEYGWERLGFSAVNPSFHLGVGFFPVDVVGIELEGSAMIAQQDLRREYASDAQGSNIPQLPQSKVVAHVGADIRARFVVNPRSRLKFAPGVGATFLVMTGYRFPDQVNQELQFTERPTAAVIGVTPVVGLIANLTPFVALYLDGMPTFYVSQGAARYEAHLLFNGATEERLDARYKQPPLPVHPFMVRVGGGVAILF